MSDPICKSCGTCSTCVPREEEARGSRMPKDNEIYQSMGWPQAPRASWMPDHLPSIDPLFAHAVFNEFAPDEKALLEKGGGRR